MSVRKSIASVAAAALAGSALALAAGSASAAYAPHPNDSKATPVSADLVGVGSDTTMLAVWELARAWNAGAKGSHPFDIATFGAVADGGTITLPGGTEINRPNGSSAGMDRLWGSGDQPEIDFARSSSPLNKTRADAGLQMFPFALDELGMAVSSSATNAPASLTPAQIVGIYKGDFTNWNQVGGTAGTIKPMIPQSGSGTRSFFLDQLKAMNGGADVALATSVGEVQEHEDDPIKADPNALAPFSFGRADLAGGTVKILGGWDAKRAVYNVVRGDDLERADIQAVFGEDGFFCSPAAAPYIEAGGLKQLASAPNGVCGVATQDPVSDFDANETVDTTTTLSATSPSANTVRLVANVAPSGEGTVTFYEGANVVRANVPVVSGQYSATLSGVAAGSHTYVARFTPSADSLARPSQSAPVTVTVSSTSTVTPPKTDNDTQCTAAQTKVKKIKQKMKKAKKADKPVAKFTKQLKKAKQKAKKVC